MKDDYERAIDEERKKLIEKNWKTAKKAELKMRIDKLVAKLPILMAEAVKFADRKGMHKHYANMAKRSIMATRKKIYKLQEELKRL